MMRNTPEPHPGSVSPIEDKGPEPGDIQGLFKMQESDSLRLVKALWIRMAWWLWNQALGAINQQKLMRLDGKSRQGFISTCATALGIRNK